jgi:hypothetical protein
MEKKDGQMRQLFFGDRVKPTAPFEDSQSWVTKTPRAFPVVIKHMPANGDNLQGYIKKKIGWHPVEMTDLRYFKEEMMSFRMHTPYVKQKVNNWAT